MLELKAGVEIEASFAAGDTPVGLADEMSGFVFEEDGVESDQLRSKVSGDFKLSEGVVVSFEIAGG